MKLIFVIFKPTKIEHLAANEVPKLLRSVSSGCYEFNVKNINNILLQTSLFLSKALSQKLNNQ